MSWTKTNIANKAERHTWRSPDKATQLTDSVAPGDLNLDTSDMDLDPEDMQVGAEQWTEVEEPSDG